jgi:RHS repeat-associated protein
MGLPTAKSIAFGNTQKHSMTFTYDASKGNLTQRTGMLNVAENFAYDNQERLTGTTAGGDSLSFNYAANGNISSKTGIGNYYYESAKPHAVTSIDNDHWQVPERTQKISYNAMGKVTSIIEEGRDTLNTITYGPDGERWTSTFKENGYHVTTLYLGDYEERIDSAGTESICYLDGGVLAVRHADGTQNIYVTYTDHLGSITRIYDEAGQEKFKASYDAWGYQSVYHNDINFYRGYTGHEMLPEFGLINMNGRLYDPLLGRFLSTDDFVQAPFDSQSFNRYSYCLNNPLKYTDPDGEIAWFIPLAMLFSGTVNVAINWNYLHDFGHGLASFTVGLASGGLAVTGSPILGAIVSGAGNSIVNQWFESGTVNWDNVIMSTGMSLMSLGVGQAIGKGLNTPITNLTHNIKNEVIKEGVRDALTGTAGGFLWGTSISLYNGDNIEDALWNGSKSGIQTGIISGANGMYRGYYLDRHVMAIQNNNETNSKGYNSFAAFKKDYGSAGEGMNWHHIVEQTPSNIAKFGPEKIHNINNLVKIPGGKGSIHAKISAYYSSKQYFTGKMTVRQWLSTKSYSEQYEFGLQTLKKFGGY